MLAYVVAIGFKLKLQRNCNYLKHIADDSSFGSLAINGDIWLSKLGFTRFSAFAVLFSRKKNLYDTREMLTTWISFQPQCYPIKPIFKKTFSYNFILTGFRA